MRYALIVAWREYAENAKTKGFWLGLFMMPAMILLSFAAPYWLQAKAAPIRYFVLVDQSEAMAPVIKTRFDRAYDQTVLTALEEYSRKYCGSSTAMTLDAFIKQGGKDAYLASIQGRLKPGAPHFEPPRRMMQQVPLPAGIDPHSSLASIAQELRPYFRRAKNLEFNGQEIELGAAILLPRDLNSIVVRPDAPAATAGSSDAASSSTDRQVQYWSTSASETYLKDEVERAVNSEIRRQEYLARGLDAAAIKRVEQTFVPFASLDPKKEAGKEAVGEADSIRQWTPSAFVYLLWLAIFVIIQMLLNNTIEEKSNRIIEVLLSSVTPGELMMGKLIGIASIGLTMVLAWLGSLIGLLMWKTGGPVHFAGPLLAVLKSSPLIPLFGLYFLLGYLMYAGFILSIGSVCNTIKEAQGYMAAMTLIMMVPLLTMTFIPRDPNGPLARALSWIPLYTPFIMMNRAGADPPLVDLIGTLVLLIGASVTALWMAGKIFRIGILRTGQPPRLVEMLRWVARR